MSLRRSTKERKIEMLDDHFVFLKKHKIDITVIEDDPINFHQSDHKVDIRVIEDDPINFH